MMNQGGDGANTRSISGGTSRIEKDEAAQERLIMPHMPTEDSGNTDIREMISGPSRPATIHKREVSWDRNVVDKSPRGTPHFSPDGSQEPSTDAADAVNTLIDIFGKPKKSHAVKDTFREATTREMTGEEEPDYNLSKSDAHLMRSLDERDPLTSGANTGKTVLAGVPIDQVHHDFQVHNSDSKDSNLPPHTYASPRPRLGSKDARMSTRPRMGTREVSGLTNSGRNGLTRQRTERSLASSRGRQAPTRHRRDNTVEEALFGLSCALSEMKRDDPRDHRFPEDDGMQNDPADPSHSADRLTATANLLMRRAKSTRNMKTSQTTENRANEEATNPSARGHSPPTSPKPSVGKSKWAFLKSNLDRNNLEQFKKSDGDSESEGELELKGLPDIEEGSQTGSAEELSENNSNDQQEDKTGGTKKPRFYLFRRKRRESNPFRHLPYANNIRQEWDLFSQFIRPRKSNIWRNARYILFCLWIPLIGIAAFLFYFKKFNNPPTGSCNSLDGYDNDSTSASWWLLFIVRETVLVCLSKMTELLIIDFLALSTRAILRTFGPMVTLLVVQSKGWPFLMFFWGLFNYALMTGDRRISHHWLFWQNSLGLFNTCNPSGNVTSDILFLRTVHIATGVGAAVAIKRVFISVILGRTTFANYSQQLAKLMNKMLHISEVATLARDIENRHWAYKSKSSDGIVRQTSAFSNDGLTNLIVSAEAEDHDDNSVFNSPKSGDYDDEDDESEGIDRIVDPDDIDPYTGSLRHTQKARIRELLGRWEDPGRGPAEVGEITIGAVFQFRRALAHMDTDFPFTGSFGLADTRASCVISAQDVYDRLMLKGHSVKGDLHFDVIASLAIQRNGELNQHKCKDLIRTFRPERDGSISMVDFVRSVDNVYKELRMLRATVASSSKIDQAVEKIFNIFFYVFLSCIILARTGYDPLAMFLSLSSVILAFAFMIGSASAKYFEGILFILIQRPYGIGDRINVSNPESFTSYDGCQGWIVEDVGLYTTTICLQGTNERATISNGTLAKSRIINCARSPQAVTAVVLKFGVDTPMKTIEVFKNGVEKFVKSRPRSWLSVLAIRANIVHSNLGYIEYVIVLQHREAYQEIGTILDDKQLVNQFCHELAKRLNMRFVSPPLPVDVHMNPEMQSQFNPNLTPGGDNKNMLTSSVMTKGTYDGDPNFDIRAVAAMFDGK